MFLNSFKKKCKIVAFEGYFENIFHKNYLLTLSKILTQKFNFYSCPVCIVNYRRQDIHVLLFHQQ